MLILHHLDEDFYPNMASSIETLREQNIARNKNFLKDLGLEPNNVVSKSKSSAPSNKKVSMSKVVLRRSPRTANIAVDYSVRSVKAQNNMQNDATHCALSSYI